MKMPEVCDENMTLPKGLEPSILSTLKLQTKFQAGQLRNFLPQWKTVTTDPTILQFVFGVKIEFQNNSLPRNNIRDPVFLILNSMLLLKRKSINCSLKVLLYRRHRKRRSLSLPYSLDRKRMARTAPFSISKSLTNS